MRSWFRLAAALFPALVVAIVVARQAPGWYWDLRSDNAVRRGAALARRQGCLSCHAAPTGEPANPGSRWGVVPSFFGGNTMMYVRAPEDVLGWIADGRPRASSPPRASGAGSPPFHMKAFRNRFSGRQIRDLAAFVLAADGVLVAPSGPAARGAAVARKLACLSCHGTGGAGGRPNPGSLTATVPGFLGPEFPHLVRDRGEFTQWVRDGRSRRFSRDRLAAHFLDRASLAMPAFGPALGDGDLDALWDYVAWLRTDPFEGALRGAPAAGRTVVP